MSLLVACGGASPQDPRERSCGDGIVDIGEACDDGNKDDTDGCLSTCALARCGDGKVQAGVEQCDDGNADSSDGCVECKPAVCGDGFVQAGVEQCDDGNANSSDGCIECKPAVCGDGLVQTGAEQCDDGNLDTSDGCPAACQLARCGDGFVETGVEVCDDAGAPGGCNNNCGKLALCGDSVVDDNEECDDGNTDTTDDCTTACHAATCTDGFLHAGVEACDDGNQADNDGCDNDCEPSRVIAVAAGGSHTCALLRSGKVRCWGDNAFGQLGYGDTERRSRPGPDIDLGGRAVQLSAGSDHTCAVLDTGAVRCWGNGVDGRLGYGNTNRIGDDETPASAGDVPLGGIAVNVSAGTFHTCAVLDTGGVRCWGRASDGQLGYGNVNTIGDNEPPSAAGDIDVGGRAVQVAAGRIHTCALLDTAGVRCWGSGAFGELGTGFPTIAIGDDEPPSVLGDVPVGGPVAQIVANQFHSCALLVAGGVRCWGDNLSGNLGYGNEGGSIGDNETPASAGDIPLAGVATQISTNLFHTCAILSTGDVRCWGFGASGRLGYGNVEDIGNDEVPASVGTVSTGGLVGQISTGGGHTCALLGDHTVRCWGFGIRGALGTGSIAAIGDDELPSSVPTVSVISP
jgi:cysteine-rich repeat protein